MQKRRRGAPRKAITASKLVNIRVTEEQHARWMALAKAEGKSLSAWLKALADGDSKQTRQSPAPRPKEHKRQADSTHLPFGSWETIRVHGNLDWMPAVVDDRQRAWVLQREKGRLAWVQTTEGDVSAKARIMTTGNFFVYFRDLLYEAKAHPSQLDHS